MFTLLGSSPEAYIPDGKVTLTHLSPVRKDSSSSIGPPDGHVSHNNENENRSEHFTRQNAQDVC